MLGLSWPRKKKGVKTERQTANLSSSPDIAELLEGLKAQQAEVVLLFPGYTTRFVTRVLAVRPDLSVFAIDEPYPEINASFLAQNHLLELSADYLHRDYRFRCVYKGRHLQNGIYFHKLMFPRRVRVQHRRRYPRVNLAGKSGRFLGVLKHDKKIEVKARVTDLSREGIGLVLTEWARLELGDILTCGKIKGLYGRKDILCEVEVVRIERDRLSGYDRIGGALRNLDAESQERIDELVLASDE